VTTPAPFALSSVIHLVRPTGRVARDLAGLRDGLCLAEAASLFHHVPLRRLHEHDAPDDFSAWVLGVLQDRETAERLAFAAQDAPPGAEPLRAALLAVLDTRAPDPRADGTVPADAGFAFLAAESVALATGLVAQDAAGLKRLLPVTDPSVWFLHLVEQPWIGSASPTLVEWLRARDGGPAADELEQELSGGRPIGLVRERVLRAWRRRGLARRIADAAHAPDRVRRDHGRTAVAGLARRLARGSG
jgi:hypothetical protein